MTNEEAPNPDQPDGQKSCRSARAPQTTDQNANPTQSPINSSESPDDDSKVKWRLNSVKSSDTFDRIMGDIDVKMEERMRQLELLKMDKNKTKTENADVEQDECPVFLDLDFPDEDDEDNENGNGDSNYNSAKRIKARRAWALVRRHIREQAMEKQNKSSLQWSMLKQTLKNMSNMEAGRETLYKKYLDPQKPRVWTEGIKSIPNDFWARNSKMIARTKERDMNGQKKSQKTGRNKPKSAKSYASVRTSYSDRSSYSVKTVR